MAILSLPCLENTTSFPVHFISKAMEQTVSYSPHLPISNSD